MEIPRLAAFRQYYNTTVHPELIRMERLRRRLIALVVGSLVVLFILLLVLLYFNVALFFLLTLLPIGFYLFYLGNRIQSFRQTFKPRIVQLILDFMNESLNTRDLTYDAKESVTWEEFMASQLFDAQPDYFQGEDYIEGKIGEMPFRMSELQVREVSPASNRLQTVFEGVFLVARFQEENEGHLAFWPRDQRVYLTRSVKRFIKAHPPGEEDRINVDHEIMTPAFLDQFFVYATEDTQVAAVVTKPMQERLAAYAFLTGKSIYAAFHDRDIYVAIAEPKDLLEPHLFQSNRSFELISEFYQDISLVTKIVEDFDQAH